MNQPAPAPVSPFTFGDPIENEDLGDVSNMFEDSTPSVPEETSATPPPTEPTPPEESTPPGEPAAITPVETPPPAEPVTPPAAVPAAPAQLTKEQLAALPKEERDRHIMIPKYRFDELNEKLKKTRETIAALEVAQRKIAAPQLPVVTPDTTAKLAQHSKLVLDGKEQEAAALMAEILNETTAAAAQTAVSQATARVDETARIREWDNTVAEIEDLVPELNPDREDYDPDLAATVLALANTYARNTSPSKALEKALLNGLKAERPQIFERLFTQTPVGAPPVTPEVPVPPVIPPPAAAAVVAAKTQQAVSRNVAAAAAQPAAIPTATPQTPVLPKATELTEEEFAALPEATRKRMRGDA